MVRCTPNCLYNHMWVWFQLLFCQARSFGRIGNQGGQFDIRWGCREEVTKRPRYVLLGHGERMSPTRNETYVKKGFHGGSVAQAGAHGSEDGILEGLGGEQLVKAFGCQRIADHLQDQRFAQVMDLGALFEGWVDEDDVDRMGKAWEQSGSDDATEGGADDDMIVIGCKEGSQLVCKRCNGVVIAAPCQSVAE